MCGCVKARPTHAPTCPLLNQPTHPPIHTGAASVTGERHWCPRKSQAAAAGTLGLLGAAATLCTTIPFTAMHDPSPQILTVDLLVGMSLAAIAAGAASRLAPQLTRRRAEQQRAQEEAAEYERIVAGPGMGGGPSEHPMDEEALAAAQCVAEWRRWEESEAWQWDEERRRIWAERLWREQHRRRLQRAAWRARQEQQAARLQWEAQRESRRQQKYGCDVCVVWLSVLCVVGNIMFCLEINMLPCSIQVHDQPPHVHHYRQHPLKCTPRYGSSRQDGMGGEYFTNTVRGGRRSDWLGYYRLLGLDATDSTSIRCVLQVYYMCT